MKIIINGYGRMGKEVEKACFEKGYDAVAVDSTRQLLSVKNADGVIDFSAPSSLEALLDYCEKNNLPLVIATTAHTGEQIEKIKAASKNIPIAYSANFSQGVAFLKKIVHLAAKNFPNFDAEIIETHHRHKKDSPSGTAKSLFDEIKLARGYATEVDGRNGVSERQNGEVGISSVRLGGYVGVHSVMFCGDEEEIVLTHRAFSRAAFAKGALFTLTKLLDKKSGLFLPENFS